MLKKLKKLWWFTLVELIVVIVILAVLSAIAFMTISKWIGTSKDTTRFTDISSIERALQIYSNEKWTLPKPDNSLLIYASGVWNVVGYQWLFGTGNISTLWTITKTPKDPVDKIYYTYFVDKNLKKFQLMWMFEWDVSEYTYNDKSYAVDYSTRNILTKGNNLWILVKPTTKEPLYFTWWTLTGIDIIRTTNNYDAYFDKDNKLSWTGQILQWLWSNINNGWFWYNAPSTCPDWFIPVPWNKDFNQPGFCVAKYEMKQKDWTAWNGRWNWSRQWRSSSTEICWMNKLCRKSVSEPWLWTWSLDGKIISNINWMPIVYLNQATAINACRAMWEGYHLITNNEWMTIARNIEMQWNNWTWWIVWVGGIYRWKNSFNNSDYTINSNPNNLDCRWWMTYTGMDDYRSLVVDWISTKCKLGNGRDKRELFLSNAESIWDLAGNVGEHVNKANSIYGNWYDVWKLKIDNDPANWNITYAWLWNESYSTHKIWWNSWTLPSDFRWKFWSINNWYNYLQGIWHLIGWYTNDTTYPVNVFVRGWDSQGTTTSGIFSLQLTRTPTALYLNVGFRCAR